MSLFNSTTSSFKANQKKNFQENIDKENVEQQVKTFNANKGFPQLKRVFQEIDSKNRAQPENDSRNFIKSRFPVYNDELKGVERQKPTEARVEEKVNKRDKEIKVVEKKSVKRSDILSNEEAYNINYTEEFLKYQAELHEKRKFDIKSIRTRITVGQRRLIIKYLIRSIAYKRYPSFIAYQAVKIFDFYTAKVEVNVDDLQTAALAALWIALKKDMIVDGIPNAQQLVDEFYGKLYRGNTKTLLNIEKSILVALGFEISFPDPFSILSLLMAMVTQALRVESVKTEILYYYGSYLIDLSLLTFDQKDHISALTLAVICTEISLYLVHAKNEENMKNPEWIYWRNEIFSSLPFLKHIFSDDCVSAVRNNLLQKVVRSKDIELDFHIVFKKYNLKRYGCVSTNITAKVSALYVNKMCDSKYDWQPVQF